MEQLSLRAQNYLRDKGAVTVADVLRLDLADAPRKLVAEEIQTELALRLGRAILAVLQEAL